MTRAAVALLVVASASVGAQVSQQWPQHSMDRPRPPVVKPGAFESAPPPSDAVVLFDGKSLAKWRSSDTTRGPAKWKVADGYMEIAPGTGGIETRDAFGDCQLHIDGVPRRPRRAKVRSAATAASFSWGYTRSRCSTRATTSPTPTGRPRRCTASIRRSSARAGRRASGSRTTSSGTALISTRKDGSPAPRITVFFNGLLAQDSVILTGPTAHQHRPPYHAHPDALPLSLQDHGNPVRFRNVWIRNLEPAPGQIGGPRWPSVGRPAELLNAEGTQTQRLPRS